MNDSISRQAAIKDAESWVTIDEYEKHLQKNIVEWLKELPSAEPERKKGKWIKTYIGGFGKLMGYCNRCGVKHPVDNFCPNCGADMKGALWMI